jgi:hypothetical protein
MVKAKNLNQQNTGFDSLCREADNRSQLGNVFPRRNVLVAAFTHQQTAFWARVLPFAFRRFEFNI